MRLPGFFEFCRTACSSTVSPAWPQERQPVHSLEVRGRAAAAEVERRGPRGRRRGTVGIGLADQAVDQYEPVAAVRLVEGFPVSAVPADLSASRMLAGEREILEERDVIVLATDRACGDRQVGVVLLGSVATVVVLRGQPQLCVFFLLWKRHYRSTDPPYESVDHRSQQGAFGVTRRRSERQPSQNLRFGDRAPDVLLQRPGQLGKWARSSKFLVQTEDQFVAGELVVQGLGPFGPVLSAQVAAGERSIGPCDGRPGAVLVLHRPHALVQDLRGISRGRRRDHSRFCPCFGFVILPNRPRHCRSERQRTAPRSYVPRRVPWGPRWSRRWRCTGCGRNQCCRTIPVAGSGRPSPPPWRP